MARVRVTDNCLLAKLDSYLLRCFERGEIPRLKEFATLNDIGSLSGLNRRMNASVGMGAGTYIRFVQLTHVEKYLLHTSLTLPEIARMTGFRWPLTLLRLFQRNHGCNPENWRRNMRPGWRQRNTTYAPQRAPVSPATLPIRIDTFPLLIYWTSLTLVVSAPMLPDSEPDEIIADYERDHARLTVLAEELGLKGDRAPEELIEDLLYASLTRRIPSDHAEWLEASFRSAAQTCKGSL